MKSIKILNLLLDAGATSSHLFSTIRGQKKEIREKALPDIEWYRKKIREKAEMEEEKRVIEEEKASAGQFNMSVKKYRELQRKGKDILLCFHTQHSMGCYRSLHLKVYEKAFCKNDTLDTYAKSCKYSPTYGEISIQLTKTELERMEIIGGVPTIKLEPVGGKVFKVKYLEGSGIKGSYQVKWSEGYLYRDYHAQSIESITSYKNDMISYVVEERKRRAEDAELKRLEIEAKKRFIGFQDSIAAGNCEVGSRMFCERHGLNKDFGYTLGYLMSLEGDNRFLHRILSRKVREMYARLIN